MTAGLALGAARLLDLLEYIEQVEQLKARPAFSVPTEFFVAYQGELADLPGLRLNLQAEGDDIWLRLPRLHESAPPEPDARLRPWMTLSDTPDKAPELGGTLADTPSAPLDALPGIADAGGPLAADAATVESPAALPPSAADAAEVQGLFDRYVQAQWQPWAAAERPRRLAIAVYNQLFALQQAIASEGVETPLELAWGLGLAAWKKEGFGTPLRLPLLVQTCDVTLDEKTLALEVRPRDAEPRLETDCFVAMDLPGVAALQATWRNALGAGIRRVNPFEAATYEGTLKAAIGHLDPAGTYEARTADLAPPVPGERLTVTNTWVLFGRRRSGDLFVEDVRRLKKKVEAAQALPGAIRSFVEPGATEVGTQPPAPPLRGLATSDAGFQAAELYFPMAYNDEQVAIARKLHASDGVVVQGPPGTGKTHTIANIICHSLAQGQRVLVTAKSETALAVLREKLPERIQPLSVALLADERDGLQQFERSIHAIAAHLSALDPVRAASDIAAAQEELEQLHARIGHIDRTVAAYAARQMQAVPFQGRELTPAELAQAVLEQAGAHPWFDDDPPLQRDGRVPVDESAIESLRRARIAVGADLVYLGGAPPAPEALPDWTEVLALHRDLLGAKAIETSIERGDLLALADSRPETLEKAQALSRFFDDRLALKARLARVSQPWLESVAKRLADAPQVDSLVAALGTLFADIRKLERRRRELVTQAVAMPANAELNEDLEEALKRLVEGKVGFTMPFGKTLARKALAETTVDGIAPASREDWALVQTVVNWRLEARRVLARWTALAGEFGLEAHGRGIDAGLRRLAAWQAIIEDMRRLALEFDAKLPARLEEVFGNQVAERARLGGEPFFTTAYASLQAHLDRHRLGHAMQRVQELLRQIEGGQGAITEALRAFVTDTLGRPEVDEAALQKSWLELQAGLARLAALQPALAEIERVATALEQAGAVRWAQRLRTHPAEADHDPLTPATWHDAWQWKQAQALLERIDGHHRLRALLEERRTLIAALARTYEDLAAGKAWLAVFERSPDGVRQALQAYLNAVQAMGSGHGVRALRHRQTARQAMQRAHAAVPCWVLPQWRVSESIPAEIGLFDLVVIDEASQSDIWALPALLRGRKLLVVGDHKQVSPSAVGIAEERIHELAGRFLAQQPHGSEMTPDKSIYDLARVVFAGQSVMLREHFRCAPAIIEFSNREFYQGEIRPLRAPRADERLDPPLVDVFVEGGHRVGDVNEPEARAIVDEIEALLGDARFAGRSIGVVTLHGTAQAARIHDLVSRRISPADVVARRLAIGPPPVFQGRERDIMLVSMVLGPGDRGAANRADMRQRFNVALSRARDRMVLFRSVHETAFKEDSLNARVIRHFREPWRDAPGKSPTLRERCESTFELELYDELVRRGFRVEPQAPCGAWRIDLVVEGGAGRRLAVECDGDRPHGAGRWQDDMARQRVLERVGWTFWRCFASSFVRQREAVLEDLLRTLERLGIEPLGAKLVDTTVWVQHREVAPGSDDPAPAGT